MTTEDLQDYPPGSCDACAEPLTDEESSAVDGAEKGDQLCDKCFAAACDNCGESLGVQNLAWDAKLHLDLCDECTKKANRPTRQEILEEIADAQYDQEKDDRMERERGR
jgi:hypothetical protein